MAAGEAGSTQLMFLNRALDALYKDAKRMSKIKEAVATARVQLKEAADAGGATHLWGVNHVEMFFTPFQLACRETKSEGLIVTSLDWLQKVVAYGYLSGGELLNPDAQPAGPVGGDDEALDATISTTGEGKANPREGPDWRLIDEVVDTICECFNVARGSERVMLQLIKALLPAVTSSECAVHGGVLLKAVKTIYNVYLISDNPVILSTAKVSLQQVIGVVFARMESAAVALPVPLSSSQLAEHDAQMDASAAGAALDPTPRGDGGESAGESRDGVDESAMGIVSVTPATPSGEANGKMPAAEQSGGEDGANTATSVEEAQDIEPGKYGFCVVCNRPANNYSIKTKAPVCSTTCRDAQGLDGSVDSLPMAVNADAARELFERFQLDAFLVFKVMCKQSNKVVPPDRGVDSPDMRNKILSLELLLDILNLGGRAFRSGDKFVAAVKQYLCGTSLLRNGVSPIPEVFGLSLSIFQTLMARFTDHLKAEIGIFFTEIFLHILESDNSTVEQKWMVLEVLLAICQQPQTIVDIFLNYDCDIKGMNIFERIVGDTARIAQGVVGPTKEGHSPLNILALECLVSILVSMVEWCKDLAENGESMPGAAADTQKNGLSGNTLSVGGGGGAGSSSMGPDGSVLDDVSEKSSVVEGGFDPADSQSLLAGGVDSPGVFEKMKEIKKIVSVGVEKFNAKPKKGIAYLQSKGQLGTSIDDLYVFLRETPGLDPAAIGDFIADPGDLNKEVLGKWVDALNFREMDFVVALRHFLGSGFRMPGEAQKIDRLMLKFADHFCVCNPDAFSSADTVYVLAYATIMLTTDLSSDAIQKKMTADEFARMTRGIDDGRDIPRDYVDAIYDSVKAEPIKVNEELPAFTADSKKKRRSAYKQESEVMVVKSRSLFRKHVKESAMFYVAKHVEHAKLMFTTSWYPMLAALSLLLEEASAPRVIALCLEGFRCAIRIASVFFLETERDAFVTSLAKFTLLDNQRAMQPKHIESIKCLINLAHSEGNFLHESWRNVLVCISQLERLQIIGAGVRHSVDLPETSAAGPGSAIEDHNSHSIAENIDGVAIDRIFTDSVFLSDEAAVEFVRQLCFVAKEELMSSTRPRIFLLQKIVDVAFYNMGRIRIVWNRMWEPIAEFLNHVGVHENRNIADLAVNSLHQLSMKFLDKDELTNFSFQKRFLKPFEEIMKGNRDTEIRDMIIACVTQLVLTRSACIRSGWKSLFNIFIEAAQEDSVSTIKAGFDCVEKVLQECFNHTTDFYVDCINCLMAYGQQTYFPDVSLKAIDYVHFCARELAEGRVEMLRSEDGEVMFTDDELCVHYWWPLLKGLASLIDHVSLAVRTKALQVLFDVLKAFGTLFDTDLWDHLFRSILVPIFDDVRHSSVTDEKTADWLDKTCLNALRSMVELVTHHYALLQNKLPDLLALLTGCILQKSESLARIGATCLLHLVTENGPIFSEDVWTLVCETFKELFDETMPKELMLYGSDDEGDADAGGGLNVTGVNGNNNTQDPTTTTETDTATPTNNESGEEEEDESESVAAVTGGGVDADEVAAAELIDQPNQDTSAGESDVATTATTTTAAVSADDSPVTAVVVTTPEQTNPSTPTVVDLQLVIVKCVVQLMLVQAVNDVVFAHYTQLSHTNLKTLLDCLEASASFAHEFNADLDLRVSLWRAGLMLQLPNLLKQETSGVSSALRILLTLTQANDDGELAADGALRAYAEERLSKQVQSVLANYIELTGVQQREIMSWTPIVIIALNGMLALDDELFKKHMSMLHPLLLGLIECERREVRTIVATLLRRVGHLYGVVEGEFDA